MLSSGLSRTKLTLDRENPCNSSTTGRLPGSECRCLPCGILCRPSTHPSAGECSPAKKWHSVSTALSYSLFL